MTQIKGKTAPIIRKLEVGPLLTNCYIMKSDNEIAIIDPGGDADIILQSVDTLEGRVKYVINTHGHIDHIAANSEIIQKTGAELLIHQADSAMLTHPDNNLSLLMGVKIEPCPATRLLSDGHLIAIGNEHLKVIHTPGHTPGSICLLDTNYIFTGDTLFLDSIGRVDFPGGSEKAIKTSLNRLQMLLRPETMLYPGHGPTGTFGRSLLINPFLGHTWLNLT